MTNRRRIARQRRREALARLLLHLLALGLGVWLGVWLAHVYLQHEQWLRIHVWS